MRAPKAVEFITIRNPEITLKELIIQLCNIHESRVSDDEVRPPSDQVILQDGRIAAVLSPVGNGRLEVIGGPEAEG